MNKEYKWKKTRIFIDWKYKFIII